MTTNVAASVATGEHIAALSRRPAPPEPHRHEWREWGTRGKHSVRMVGKPYLIGLWKRSPSSNQYAAIAISVGPLGFDLAQTPAGCTLGT